ncbi:MAG: MFS transporter [Candidatus Hodarchaeales archaeon]|jgi:DHA3 family macrolide efflux protein-like MFS transporter
MASSASTQRFHSYLYFWGGQIISLLGSTIVQFVLIWWIVVEYLNPIYLALAYLFGIGVQVIFMPIAGVFVDRWNRKITLFVFDSLQAVGAFLLILLFTIKDQLTAETMYLLVLSLLCFRGIMSSFHHPAAKAIIPLMVPHNQLDRMNGLQALFLGVVNIIGPAIGALLYGLLNQQVNLIIWIDCITFLIAVFPLLFIEIPEVEKKPPIPGLNGLKSFTHEFRDALALLRSKKGFIPLLITITLINFLEIPIIVLGPFFIYTIFSGSVQDLALVVIASQLGLLISGSILAVKNGWKRKARIIIIALYVQLFGYFWQVVTPINFTWSFWFMAIGAFIFGSMLPVVNSLFQTIIQVTAPPEIQGRVTSIVAAAAGAILPIGMLISGPLAEILGIRELFFLAVATGFFVVSFMWVFTNLSSLDHPEDVNVKQESVPKEKAMNIST